MVIRKDKEESVKGFLDRIMNKYGFNELEVCCNYKNKEGDIFFSKWINWFWLQHQEDKYYIGSVGMTKERFIKVISHRRILDIEVLIDVDDLKVDNKIMFPSTENKTKWITRKLTGDFVVCSTGSKGFHISLIIPELRQMSAFGRKKAKEKIFRMYGGDLQKSSERVLISVEGSFHWRSGKIKQEVFL